MTQQEKVLQHFDAVDTFNSDVRGRKSLVPSAGKKPKKTGCTLPSDYLTSAQKKKLSGEVKNINLNSPMKYEEFKALPLDLRKEYLDKIVHQMGATLPMLAEMLGVSVSKASYLLKEYGVKPHYRGYRIPSRQLSEWEQFVAPFKKKEESQTTPEPEKEPAKAMYLATKVVNIKMEAITFTVKASTWAEVAQAIANLECPIPDAIRINIAK